MTLQAVCKKAGRPDKMVPDLEALPAELEWGQILVSLRAVPVNPADLHTIQTGGIYLGSRRSPPFVLGHDGVGVVMQVNAPARKAHKIPRFRAIESSMPCSAPFGILSVRVAY